MSLTIFGPSAFAQKSLIEHTSITETTVDGNRAVWTEGEHVLQMQNGDYQPVRLVTGSVLVWTEESESGSITYRLESTLPLEEAVRIAESLQEAE